MTCAIIFITLQFMIFQSKKCHRRRTSSQGGTVLAECGLSSACNKFLDIRSSMQLGFRVRLGFRDRLGLGLGFRVET